MSSQITNNNYVTALTFPNSYIFRQLNDIDKARIFKKEQDDWTRLYHKTLKGLEAMIDVQKQVRDMIKIAGKANIMMIEIEITILNANINKIMNTTNILEILEDL